MSVLNCALVASPPEIPIVSPPDISTEYIHDPYGPSTSGSSSSYNPSLPQPSFHLTMPPSKRPRNPSGINPFIGADGELDLGDGSGAHHSFTSSPQRRGRHYPSIHQGVVLPHSGYTTTPKNMNMGVNLGLSSSTDPTPSRFGTYSSPANNSPLTASMRYAGDDTIAGQWALGAGSSSRRNDIDEDDEEDGMGMRMGMGLSRGEVTPTQSPVPSRVGSKRSLSGLGESPMRTVKRSRFASMGTASNHSSVPPSPSRASTLPSSTLIPGEHQQQHQQPRSASLAAPPFSTQSRHVSSMSMVSSASTELMSPHLNPYDSGTGYDMMPSFPTSMSAPEMADLSAMASYDPQASPYLQPTISPHDILPPHSSGYRTMSSTACPPATADNTHPTTSPSLAHAPQPYYASRQPSMALDTIHEVDQGGPHPTSEATQHGNSQGTPTLTTVSGPPSTGAPSNRTLPDGRSLYPASAFAPYRPHSPTMAPGPEFPESHQQTHHPVLPPTYRPAPTPPQPELGHSPVVPNTPTYWNTGMTDQAQTGAYQPRQPPPHNSAQRQYQYSHPQQGQTYIHPSTTYYPAPPAHQYPPPAAPPHAYMVRSVSDSTSFAPGYGGPSDSPYHPAPSFGHVPSPSSYPSHPSLTRSVSTPFVHSGSMPGVGHFPALAGNGGLYPPAGAASAPMTSSVSLPTPAESALYMGESNWDTNTGSAGPGIGLGFGPPPSESHQQSYEWQSSGGNEVPTSSTPTTPSRKRHPSVGTRLKPGPKPRQTPKKRGGRGGKAAAAVPAEAPSSPLTAQDDDTDDLQASAFPSPEVGTAHGPSQYFRPRPRFHTAAGAGPSAEAGANLELGGPLSQEHEHGHDQPHPHSEHRPRPRPRPGPGPSHLEYTHHHPQPHHYPHAQVQLQAHLHPQSGSSYSAPQLHLEPVARPSSPEGSHMAGLPVEVIDRLFVTYVANAGPGTQPVKRFKCLIEGCEREFPRKSAIKSHIQTHLDDKPFVCRVVDCSASFVRQHDLKRHMKIHTGFKPFPCDCGKVFARGDALRRHKERNLTSQCQNGEQY